MAGTEVLHAYGYLTQPEVRFLDAAAERLIPTDEHGPGGRDAGVAVYIDRQLSGSDTILNVLTTRRARLRCSTRRSSASS